MTQSIPSLPHIRTTDFTEEKFKTRVLTENLESLHEKTGVLSVRVNKGSENKPELREKVTGATVVLDPTKLQVILCIGLSDDQSGLLSYLVERNPTITIISINPSKALEKFKHYWVQGASEIILPELVRQITP